MSDGNAISLETDPLEPAVEPGPVPAQPQPVVVIQYRSRGIPWILLVPLLLLFSVGTMVVYHELVNMRRRVRDGGEPVPPVPTRTKAPSLATGLANPAMTGEQPVMPPPNLDVARMPLSLNTQPVSPSELTSRPVPTVPPLASIPEKSGDTAASTAGKPVEPGAASPAPPIPVPLLATAPATPAPPTPKPPIEKAAVAVGFQPFKPERPRQDSPHAEDVPSPDEVIPAEDEPPTTVAAGGSSDAEDGQRPTLPSVKDAPIPSKEKLLLDVRAEAEQKRADVAHLRDQKERAAQDARLHAIAKAEEQRFQFHEELAEILRTGGNRAGQDINALCDRSGRRYNDKVHGDAMVALRRAQGRMTLKNQVRALRDAGVPEAGILDFLANRLHRTINSRGGPRDPDQVRVIAARQLLGSFRLSPDNPATAQSGQASSR